MRLTIAFARVRGVALRRRADVLRPLLRFAELRFVPPLFRPLLRLAELRLAEPRLDELRLDELRFEELRFAPPLLRPLLRFAELRLAELRFAVRLVLPRAADLLRDDFFAAMDVCSCRGGWFAVLDSKIRAHNLRTLSQRGQYRHRHVSFEGEKCVEAY